MKLVAGCHLGCLPGDEVGVGLHRRELAEVAALAWQTLGSDRGSLPEGPGAIGASCIGGGLLNAVGGERADVWVRDRVSGLVVSVEARQEHCAHGGLALELAVVALVAGRAIGGKLQAW